MNSSKIRMIILLATVVILACGYAYMKEKDVANMDKKETVATIPVYLVDASLVDAFSVTSKADGVIKLKREGEVWKSENDPSIKINESVVNVILSNLTNIEASGVIESPDLAKYGLDKPVSEYSVTIGGGTTSMQVGSSNAITGEVYLMLNNDSSVVYTTPSNVSGPGTYSLTSLTAKE